MARNTYEVRAIDPAGMRDWSDGTFLCLRYSREAAEQAVLEFQPRWPEKRLIIVEITLKESKLCLK